MALRIVIPVKPFAEAKQRLAVVLSPAERAELAERMFRHVFAVALGFSGARNVLVVSRSHDILAIVQTEGAVGLLENPASDLNVALAEAGRFAHSRGESKVLVLASDLVLLGESDLAEIARYECAIAPDRHQRGTNALLWPVNLVFQFGDNSFARHRAIARSAALHPQVISRPGLAHDIDIPADLSDLPFLLPRPGQGKRSG